MTFKSHVEKHCRESPENFRMFRQEEFKLSISQLIYDGMVRKKITKTQLAKKLGIAVSTLNRYLDGNGDLKINTLVSIFHELGSKLVIKLTNGNEI
jgi:DNA-binding phage protein